MLPELTTLSRHAEAAVATLRLEQLIGDLFSPQDLKKALNTIKTEHILGQDSSWPGIAIARSLRPSYADSRQLNN